MCVCLSVHVIEILRIQIKPHDMGIPAVRPDTVRLPHSSTNTSLFKIVVPGPPLDSVV